MRLNTTILGNIYRFTNKLNSNKIINIRNIRNIGNIGNIQNLGNIQNPANQNKELDKKYKLNYQNGKLWKTYSYKNGKYEDEYKSYYENG